MVHGLLVVVASRCRAQALDAQASVVVARGLSSCGLQALECRLSSSGVWALLLCGMWDLPRPGLKPCPLHWQADSQLLRHQGSPWTSFKMQIPLRVTLVKS